MNITRLVLALLLTSASLPVQAQVSSSPEASAAAKAPDPKCACDDPGFKPLNEKARAVAAYWTARRKYKSTSGVVGVFGIFAIISRNAGAIQEAQNALGDAQSELYEARSKAESMGGIKLVNGDDKTVEVKLIKDVDYTIAK